MPTKLSFKPKPKFLDSDKGKLAQYRTRKRKRIHIFMDDLEPKSKKMGDADRDQFQKSVIDQMAEVKRKAFRRGVALSIQLSTTSKNAPQGHTIAKNILDLLGTRRPSVVGSERDILYKDDSQIQALSVSCSHGQKTSMIHIEGRPFRSMLADLELATHAAREMESSDSLSFYREEEDNEWGATLKDLLQNESARRSDLGSKTYEAYLQLCRWYAQRAKLAQSAISTAMLAWLYDLSPGIISDDDMWANLLNRSALRLKVGELPTVAGSSDVFRQQIDHEIGKFKAAWSWLIEPLVIPVALEVIVRPGPSTPPSVLHDLDNIVRSYLIPKIVPSFDTVSDNVWTIDLDDLQRTNPTLADHWRTSMPPKSTRSGVTRYDVWRLPSSTSGKAGFVSVAIVADTDGKGGLIRNVDDKVVQWEKIIEKNTKSNRRFRRI